jgi:tetratricopeptide (TPR) repeat protein
MTKRLFLFSPTGRSRKNYFRLIPCVSLYCLCWIAANATVSATTKQIAETRELSPNAPIERQLQSGDTHVYTITLAAGTYLRLAITPKEGDLQPQLFAPGGADVGAYTSLTGTGLKSVTAIAESAGSYRLEIRPVENAAGRYEVKIEELRPATERDRRQVAAEKVEGEGYRLTIPSNTAEQKKQGIAKYEEALTLWRGLGERKAELRTMFYLAKNYRERGETNIALKYTEQAIEIARDLGERYQEADLMVQFGLIYKGLGENQKALDSFNQARQLYKSLSAKYGEAIAINHLGSTLAALGELQVGQRYLEEALPTFSAVGDPISECGILNTLGNIYRLQGDRQKGIEFYHRALAISRQIHPQIVEANSLILLGNAYLELGDWQKALDSSEQAVKLSRTLGYPLGEGDGLKLIGDAAYLSGDHQKALDFLKESLHLFRSMRERDREAKTLHSLARVNYTLGNYDEAKKQIEQALEIQESLRSNILSQQLRETIFTAAQSSFALYIDLLMQLHKKNPAAGYAVAALQASERARARSLLDVLAESRAAIRQGVPQHLLEREHSLQQQINAKATARTRLLSAKTTQAQAAAFDKEITELSSRYRDLQVQIRQSSPRYAALTQPQPLAAAEIQQQLDDETVLLEFALGEKQSWLWAVTRSSIDSYQLPSSSQLEPVARKVYQLLTARQPQKGDSETLYQTRVLEAEVNFQTESATLSQMLLGQIAAKLQQEWKGKRLAIVAPGTLEYIPFGALPAPEAGSRGVAEEGRIGNRLATLPTSPPPHLLPFHPLIADHEIVNLPSASALAALRRETYGRKRAEKAVAVLADPVFQVTDSRLANALRKTSGTSLVAKVRSGSSDQLSVEPPSPTATIANADLLRSSQSFTFNNGRGGFARLPFSREEAEAIASLAPRNSLMKATDFQANRATATSGELGHYRIIHFATHGLLNSKHPELSGLVLSLVDENGKEQEGFLRLQEIYNLNLPADLVVLSACQTALGKEIKGEGLVGLTRGFMYAGAERVVASLWQVDDLATAQLMKSFYRGILKEGLRPAAALRAAQLEMIKQKRWSSAFFWAAFTMQGEWK